MRCAQCNEYVPDGLGLEACVQCGGPLRSAAVVVAEAPRQEQKPPLFPAVDALNKMKYDRAESIATGFMLVITAASMTMFFITARRFSTALDAFPDVIGFGSWAAFTALIFFIPGMRFFDRFGDMLAVVERANRKEAFIEPPRTRPVNFLGVLGRLGFGVVCALFLTSAFILINSGLDRQIREDQPLSWRLEEGGWRGFFAPKRTIEVETTDIVTPGGRSGTQKSVLIKGLNKNEQRNGLEVTVWHPDRPDRKWKIRIGVGDFTKLKLDARLSADIGQGFLSVPWLSQVRVTDGDERSYSAVSNRTYRGNGPPSPELLKWLDGGMQGPPPLPEEATG